MCRRPNALPGQVYAVCVWRGKAVSGSVDASIRVWDVATGAPERVLLGHANAVTARLLVHGRRLIRPVPLSESVRVSRYPSRSPPRPRPPPHQARPNPIAAVSSRSPCPSRSPPRARPPPHQAALPSRCATRCPSQSESVAVRVDRLLVHGRRLDWHAPCAPTCDTSSESISESIRVVRRPSQSISESVDVRVGRYPSRYPRPPPHQAPGCARWARGRTGGRGLGEGTWAGRGGTRDGREGTGWRGGWGVRRGALGQPERPCTCPQPMLAAARTERRGADPAASRRRCPPT